VVAVSSKRGEHFSHLTARGNVNSVRLGSV